MNRQLLTEEENKYLDDLEFQGRFKEARDEGDLLQKKRMDLKNVLSTEFGRNIIWDTLSRCDIFGTSMTGNSQTYFKEGRRSVGLELLSEILIVDPDAWIEMQKERRNEILRALTESE